MPDTLKTVLTELGLDLDKLPKEITESNRSGDLMLALLVQEMRNATNDNMRSHKVLFDKIECFEAKFNDRDGTPGIFTRIGVLESGVSRLWLYYGGLALTVLTAAVIIIRDHLAMMG